MHLAAMSKTPAMVDLLCDEKLDVDASTTRMHLCPLLLAVLIGSPETVECLLKHDANPNTAITFPQEEVQKALQEAPKEMADLFTMKEFGLPLMFATMNDDAPTIKLLLAHGATPLSTSAQQVLQPFIDENRCKAHLQQLAKICLEWVKAHDNRFPMSATVWQDLKIPKELLVCPGKSDLDNGYCYNVALEGKTLKDFAKPGEVIMFADCKRADHLIHVADDIDKSRHTNCFCAAYLDGNAASTNTVTLQ
jgi:hypothetical protein